MEPQSLAERRAQQHAARERDAWADEQAIVQHRLLADVHWTLPEMRRWRAEMVAALSELRAARAALRDVTPGEAVVARWRYLDARQRFRHARGTLYYVVAQAVLGLNPARVEDVVRESGWTPSLIERLRARLSWLPPDPPPPPRPPAHDLPPRWRSP